MDAERLCQIYPFLDHLLAETLLKMSEQGKLEGYLQDWPDRDALPRSEVVQGAVVVENSLPAILEHGERNDEQADPD